MTPLYKNFLTHLAQDTCELQFLPTAINPHELWHVNAMSCVFSWAREASYLDTSSKFLNLLVIVPMLKALLISHSKFSTLIQLQKHFWVWTGIHTPERFLTSEVVVFVTSCSVSCLCYYVNLGREKKSRLHWSVFLCKSSLEPYLGCVHLV